MGAFVLWEGTPKPVTVVRHRLPYLPYSVLILRDSDIDLLAPFYYGTVHSIVTHWLLDPYT